MRKKQDINQLHLTAPVVAEGSTMSMDELGDWFGYERKRPTTFADRLQTSTESEQIFSIVMPIFSIVEA